MAPIAIETRLPRRQALSVTVTRNSPKPVASATRLRGFPGTENHAEIDAAEPALTGWSSQLTRLTTEEDPRQTCQTRQSRQFTPLLLMASSKFIHLSEQSQASTGFETVCPTYIKATCSVAIPSCDIDTFLYFLNSQRTRPCSTPSSSAPCFPSWHLRLTRPLLMVG
jgi:hypothetical protein